MPADRAGDEPGLTESLRYLGSESELSAIGSAETGANAGFVCGLKEVILWIFPVVCCFWAAIFLSVV
jgi:hypothetical protein